MIAIDLCKVNYQTLLIIYLKLTKKNVRNARENVNLSDLKVIDCKKWWKEWKECKDGNRWKECKKTCTKSKDGLIKRFPRIYKFFNGDLNKFVLLLRKGIYPYEYMDSWEIFGETSLPDKEAFYSELNLEDITDED